MRPSEAELGPRSQYQENESHPLRMASFSPVPSYGLGGAYFGRGVMAILSPREEYAHMGLPLESKTTTNIPPMIEHKISEGFVSPLMYLKGFREVSYGLA